jgi:phospholipase C
MKLAIRALSVLALLVPGIAYSQSVTFQHIVFIVQENRSPDNLFGSNPTFEPGVDIATSGLNSLGQTIPLTAIPLANCYEVIHGHNQFLREYDNGKMDGADKVTVVPNPGCTMPTNPQFKYVDNSTGTIQPYFDLATNYGYANRMFQTNEGPSFPAHQFILSGTSAPTTTSNLFASDNTSPSGPVGCLAAADVVVPLLGPTGQIVGYQYPCFEHPTLTDLLDNAPQGPISWAYYAATASSIVTAPNAINHMCTPATVSGKLTCTAKEWTNHVAIPQTRILNDIRNCRLRSVDWVTPDGAESDLPGGNTGLGPSWIASIVNSIGNSTCGYWENTAILIFWDDWGGWYEHVPPFQIGQSNGWGAHYVYGFRVPLIVVSAYTPQGYVDNSNHDFGSLLQFVETNFGGLGLIGPGDYADAYSDNLSSFFTLTSPRVFTPVPAVHDADFFLHYHFNTNQLGPDPDGDEE